MKKIEFTKMVASGNDFVVIRGLRTNLSKLAKNICRRSFGIGADGLLVLEKSKKADMRMRIFNSDGSEAQMCGNGSRCAAYFLGKKRLTLETKAGILAAFVKKDNVKIKLSCPSRIKENIVLDIFGRKVKVDFVNTGVPHTVIFVQGLDKIDVFGIGRLVRYAKIFAPAGTNVDFVEVAGKNIIKLRTYERGVENETLACGTGSAASALVFASKSNTSGPIKVHTRGGEILTISFTKEKNTFKDVWLQGRVKIVYKGVYYV